MSKLEEILQAEAESEIKEIMAEAEDRAEKIVSEAKNRAESQVAAEMKRIEAEERAALQKIRSLADHRLAVARIRAKGEAIEQVLQKVRVALEEISSESGYGEVLEALAAEAVELVGRAEAVVVHPSHEEKLENWAQRQKLELRKDPGLGLGVRIVGQNGAAVENTLEERLRRAWPKLNPEVIAILWERGREID